MFTEKEKNVLKSIVAYHLREVQQDKKFIDPEILSVMSAEAKYELVLKEILKKLK